MFASVLVPLDGSRFAEAALPAALELVQRSDAVLHLVQVHHPPALLSPEVPVLLDPAWIESIRADEAAYVAGVRERVEATLERTCVTRLLDGLPAEAITGYARAEKIELIVIASHGRGGLSRFWLGSVADALVRKSPGPLLLIRPPEDETESIVAPTVTNILVPLDGSELSHGVLPFARIYARAVEARVTLLRVVPGVAGPGVFGPVPLDELVSEATARANAELEELAKQLRSDGIAATHVVEVSAAVAPTILEYVRGAGGDAIAIATHGRGGLGRAALGSVADKVVRGAEVPVLIVRAEAVRADSAHAEYGRAGAAERQPTPVGPHPRSRTAC